ncbi:RNA methyltransferase [Aerococcus urinaehominis]|uniref:RNA methyltransferase n=1 Tax=Aerococcus urinaehominis TaxID=128944 RepID=A0A0X8FLE0_9LACT|nr:23S rRNA (uracil(1939)-C(5))-methyltransferase RlmD [Aerococcus urinaehominis]AMB99463.1 RNA methyltransferase [Aerococcus urinaehominis]SDM61477.1 23S rRNA (uracil1939-C5)-methyltransferase [Aerococcus urinaehominis]
MKQTPPVKKNDRLEVEIEDLTYERLGLAKVNGFPLFIANALPTEKCLVHVVKVTKRFAYAKLVERYNDAAIRVPLVDEDGLRVGTMPLQHMAYEAQLAFKQDQVQRLLAKSKLEAIPVKATLGMDDPWHYRNKAQVPIGQKDGQLYTGFFRKGSHDILPIEDYQIQLPGIDEALQTVIDILNDYRVSAYNEKTHQGQLRHLIVRRAYYTNEMMIILVVNGQGLAEEAAISQTIVAQVPSVVSVVLNSNQAKTNVIMGPNSRVLYGEDYYQDRMLGLDFMISSQSFFQVNTAQAEVLYQEAIKAAELTGQEKVVDAYCGIGSISLNLAKQAGQVYAMEIVPAAIDMAKKNARINELDNVHFEVGKAEDVMPQWQDQGLDFDVVVVDPPRKGLAPSFIDAAVATNPDRIVYVSCNPASLVRDLEIFAEQGYQTQYIQPVDMFPQTHHIESVALLTKVKTDKS